MASGVKTNDDCVKAYERLKTEHTAKCCVFKLNKNYTEVELETEVSCGKHDDMFDAYDEFMTKMPKDQCRYGVFEYGGRKDTEGKMISKAIFVSWAPDSAAMKQKMVHASSLNALKIKLNLGDIIQAADPSDLSEDTICERLKIKLDKEHLQQQRLCHCKGGGEQVQQQQQHSDDFNPNA
ncbi:actophorin-like [Argopecten irradians]|uniref:actophorin-like n=1 Tax=Argopecten irradians TaxID=31199 RepID=UPI003719DF93